MEGGKGGRKGGRREGNRKGKRKEGGKREGGKERENLKLERLSHHIHKSVSLAIFHKLYSTACVKCG